MGFLRRTDNTALTVANRGARRENTVLQGQTEYRQRTQPQSNVQLHKQMMNNRTETIGSEAKKHTQTQNNKKEQQVDWSVVEKKEREE